MGETAVEDSNRPERYIDQAVFPPTLHQLNDLAIAINFHDYVRPGFTVHTNDLTLGRNSHWEEIRFDDDTGNNGTHSAPQQLA